MLEQLEFAQSVASGSQQVLRLDSDIMDSVFALAAGAASGDLSDISSQSDSLRAMILKRSYTYSGVGEEQMQQQIDTLSQQISALRATSQGSSSRINHGALRYFSALADGYEGVLTPESLETLTPSALRSLQPASVSEDSVGQDDLRHDLVLCDRYGSGRYGKMAVGDTVTLRFMSGLDQDLSNGGA